MHRSHTDRELRPSPISFLLLVAVCAGALAGTSAAQQWTQLQTTDNVALNPGMSYDTTRNRVVWVGKLGTDTVMTTEEFNPVTNSWATVSATGPSGRWGSNVAYHAVQQRTILFGGEVHPGFILMNDTWSWNGTAWTQLGPSVRPSARFMHEMVYDSTNSRIVLFGGYADSGTSIELGDTWLWNGTTWTQASPSSSPSPRVAAAMAFDPSRGRVVLFGGVTTTGSTTNTTFRDTWEWNGATQQWTLVANNTGPSARGGATMAFNPATNRVVLFGGYASTAYQSDSWEWNGSSWTQVFPAASPSPRSRAKMVTDTPRGRVLLRGGWDGGFVSDTWEYRSAPSGTAPTITQHPQGQTRCAGQSVSFSVAATGTAPLSYQWRKNNVNIGGATGSSYAISSVSEAHEGNYRCVVTNAFGSATSNQAFLTVNSGPTITQHPASVSAWIGERVTFSVTATGDGRTYQWQRGGVDIPNATNSSYTIRRVRGSHVGNYRCIVTTNCGSVTSNSAALSLRSSKPRGLR
jgi:hypothetical protein